MDTDLEMFKELTEVLGVPGNEGPVREVVRRYFAPLGELSQDRMGSLVCRKDGASTPIATSCAAKTTTRR